MAVADIVFESVGEFANLNICAFIHNTDSNAKPLRTKCPKTLNTVC
jgi:hypothetical protein